MSIRFFIPENKDTRREIIASTILEMQKDFVEMEILKGDKPLLSQLAALEYTNVLVANVKRLDQLLWGKYGILRDGYQKEEWDSFCLIICGWLKELESKVSSKLSVKEFRDFHWHELLYSHPSLVKISRELAKRMMEKKIVDVKDPDLLQTIFSFFTSDEEAERIIKTIEIWERPIRNLCCCFGAILDARDIVKYKQPLGNSMLTIEEEKES